ncbi:hypothetical protein D3C81_725050 [compost metagenome]
MFHEPAGGEHLDLAGVDVGLVDHAAHAAEVVGMGMAVDHRHHRFARTVLVVQIERGTGGFGGGQRVDDDQPVVAFDDGHVGQVQAAYLVQPGYHFEQPGMVVQLSHAPEAGVDRGGAVLLLEEVIAGQVPDRLAVGIHDLPLERCDQPAADGGEIGIIAERPLLEHGGVVGAGLFAGGFGVHSLA